MNPIVLIAHRDPATCEELRDHLTERGYGVLGPVGGAGLALTLAAQTPASFAIVGEQLSGKRCGRDLARALRETWGIPCLMLKEPGMAA